MRPPMTPPRPLAADGHTRRQLLLGAATMLAAFGTPAASAAGVPDKIVAIDWAAAETLLTLGLCPAGIADIRGFLASFGETAGPCSSADLGSPWEPNLELLDRMRPTVIYISPWNALSQSVLSEIAPIRISPVYDGTGQPLERALVFARQMLADFPETAKADVIAGLQQRLAAVGNHFGNGSQPQVLIVNLHGSGRFANVYGTTSMTGNVIAHLGLSNAWTEGTNGFGFARIGIERLIDTADASIIVVGQGEQTRRALQTVQRSAVWQAIPAVRQQRLFQSPPVSLFGGLASATQFAEWVARSLPRQG